MFVIPLVIIFCTVILYLAGAFNVPAPDRMFLSRLAIVALLIRLLFIVATQTVDTAFFSYLKTSDAQYYEQMGKALANAWQEGKSVVIPSENYGYHYWNGIIYYLVGFKPDFVRVLNSITSVCIGFNLYFIMLRLNELKAARISFVLGAFFPSSILWSTLNLKDSLIIFLITLIARQNLELLDKFRLGKVLFMCVMLMALVSLRFYVGILLALCITLSNIFTATKFLWWQRISYTMVIFLIAGFALQQMGYGFMGSDYVLKQSIETIGEQHQKAAYGSGAYAEEANLNTYVDAIKYLPVGIFYFLFGPLPWQSMGPMRIITVPEMAFLYFSYGYFIMGVRHFWRTQRGACLFLLIIIITFGLIYSLGSANIGGLYRVRLQVIMLSFAIISTGMQRSWALGRIFRRLVKRRTLA